MSNYVVLGGGIAGVSCVEALCYFDEEASVTLISASPLIKTVTNYVKLTRVAETFDVEEQPLSHAQKDKRNLKVVQAAVKKLSTENQCLELSDGSSVKYDKLCICTGGKPKVISTDNPYVVGIRDTESVKQFQEKIKNARRIIIVGNGGIATELVCEIEGCEVIWAIRDKSIAHTFVDAGAGQFFLDNLQAAKQKGKKEGEGPSKRLKYTAEASNAPTKLENMYGGALGPDWASELEIHGMKDISHDIHVETEVEVDQILTNTDVQGSNLKPEVPEGWSDSSDWPIYVKLTSGKLYGCDLVVSATGVSPCTDVICDEKQFKVEPDGGLAVDDKMRTSVENVYAAGDCCTATWDKSPHWLQMRLWSQARQMGSYAAKAMVADMKKEEIHMDFCFELFAHVTTFFRFKVVLLGRFNAQGLGRDYEVLLRVTKGEEYVKVLLQNGRMVGAILIGETDLEETFENLILNGTDLTPFKENLLEPTIDIEDFFD